MRPQRTLGSQRVPLVPACYDGSNRPDEPRHVSRRRAWLVEPHEQGSSLDMNVSRTDDDDTIRFRARLGLASAEPSAGWGE